MVTTTEVRLHAATTGAVERRIPLACTPAGPGCGGSVRAALTPDGATIVVSNLGRIVLLDAATGAVRNTLNPVRNGAFVFGFALAPAGDHLAVGAIRDAVLLSLPSGTEVARFERMTQDAIVPGPPLALIPERKLVVGDGDGVVRVRCY